MRNDKLRKKMIKKTTKRAKIVINSYVTLLRCKHDRLYWIQRQSCPAESQVDELM